MVTSGCGGEFTTKKTGYKRVTKGGGEESDPEEEIEPQMNADEH